MRAGILSCQRVPRAARSSQDNEHSSDPRQRGNAGHAGLKTLSSCSCHHRVFILHFAGNQCQARCPRHLCGGGGALTRQTRGFELFITFGEKDPLCTVSTRWMLHDPQEQRDGAQSGTIRYLSSTAPTNSVLTKLVQTEYKLYLHDKAVEVAHMPGSLPPDPGVSPPEPGPLT